MKQCSKCQQTYADDNLNFCLLDGTPLGFVADSSEETIMIPSPVVLQTSQPTRQGVNPLFAYATIAFLALIIGGGIVGWIMSSSNASVNKADLTVNSKETENTQDNKTVGNLAPNKNTPATNRVEPTSIPEDTKAIENEVKTALDGWTQTLVNRDFDEHLQYYADKLDVYYKNKNVDFSFVRNKNLKLFKKYSTFGLINSNIKIDVDSNSGQIITVFDSAYEFRGDSVFLSGVGQAEFRWKRINGMWKITSEKTLQTYNVSKK